MTCARGGVLAILVAAAAPGAALAQTADPTLTSLSVADSTPSDARILLNTDGKTPKFEILNNDAPSPQLILDHTQRGPAAAKLVLTRGPVRDIDIRDSGRDLSLVFGASAAIHLDVATLPGNGLVVLVKRAGATRQDRSADNTQSDSRSRTPADLPAHRDFDPDEAFEVIPLRYADVSEIVGLLSDGPAQRPNDVFIPQEPAFGSSGITGTANNTQAYQQAQMNGALEGTALGVQVDDSIGIDRRLNAIIVRGKPDRIRALKERIAKLDRPIRSVLFETVFVELTETGAKAVGIDFKNSAGKLGVVTVASGAFLPGSGIGGSGPSSAGQVSTSFQAALAAQVARGEGKIISRPKISAQSGATAKIITGDALPILTSIALSGVNAVSQQVQYVNVGVTLQIAPRISEDGNVTSHVFCEVSSVTGYAQGYPTISQREASTTATVRDGEYFVIGGLTQENRISNDDWVPGASRLPLVGRLFSMSAFNRSKTQLYIVVMPHIATAEDARRADAIVNGGP